MDNYKGYQEPDFLPGDILLYSPKGFYGWLIAVKTWHMISHVEIYIGFGTTIAARSAGVNYYPLELNDRLAIALRPPVPPFDIKKALAWFNKNAKGQAYDWKGLLRFTSRKPYTGIVSEDAQFCSELGTRFLRNGDLPVFGLLDADSIAPFQFLGETCLKPIIPASQVTGVV